MSTAEIDGSDGIRDSAGVLCSEGKWEEAIALLSDSIEEEDDPKRAARLKLALADTYNLDLVSGRQHRDEALSLLDEVESFATGSGDDELLAAALHGRGMALHIAFIRGHGDPDRELASFERAADLRRKLGDKQGEAASRCFVGIFHHVDRLDRETAAPILREAYDLAGASGERSARSEAARHLGQIQQELGDPAGALPLLTESLELMEEGAPSVSAFGFQTRAQARLEAGDVDGAREDLAEARTRAERFNLPLAHAFIARTEADLLMWEQAPGVWDRRHP